MPSSNQTPPTPLDAGIPLDKPFNPEAFEKAIQAMIDAAGIASTQPHMQRSAQKVRELWETRLLGGYKTDIPAILGDGFPDERKDMVVITGISIYGVCPHHLLPFRGVAHVAYLPGGVLHGFGRIARLVDALAHRFTYQEWLTNDIAKMLIHHGKAAGAACTIEAEQLCLLLGEDRRGDERVVTQAFSGAFETDHQLRADFSHAIQQWKQRTK